ncbi:hypothetical protein FNV43_RR22582 [Rhamnella rubrinervis]|uniref:Uncharacterized protein n=1 Tax=Rhamnella rubrinervis TaxID=2594499 RepID=A0A8K0GSM3_9ROSA|nr:hypothetical protein FNV43_RR22582 [Rhamnella rubrinervis]
MPLLHGTVPAQSPSSGIPSFSVALKTRPTAAHVARTSRKITSPTKKPGKRYSPYKGIGFSGKKPAVSEDDALLDVAITETYSTLLKGPRRGDKSPLEPRLSQPVTLNDNIPRRNRTAALAASRLATFENIVGNLVQSVEQVLKCLPQGAIQRLQDPPAPPKAGAPNTYQVTHSGQAGSNRQEWKVPQGASSHVGGNNREDQNILLEEGSHQEAKRATVWSILEEVMDEMREKATDKVLREGAALKGGGRNPTTEESALRHSSCGLL